MYKTLAVRHMNKKVPNSVVMGTLFPTRVPIDLLPPGTRVPVYWMENLFSFKMNAKIINSTLPFLYINV